VACPDDQALRAVLDGSATPAVAQHVDSCESCREVVAVLSHGGARPDRTAAPIGERYEVKHELGRGGMGTVYLAHDRTLGRDVALKLHRVDRATGSAEGRLQREALAMAKLAHPNVVSVFEIGDLDDRMYVAMEYVRGGTLRAWAEQPHSWREIVAMLVATGRGLAAAHAVGLVHRDFKPENVLVGEDGRPRVGDFGLARSDAGSTGAGALAPGALTSTTTATASASGTPAYMAPEQMTGELVDARSDQFAFCVVAWECLFGKRPFAGATVDVLAHAIAEHRLAPTTAKVPDRVRAVLDRGLAAATADRFADMPTLLAALERAAAPRTARNAIAVAAGLAVLLGGGLFAQRTLAAHRLAARCDDAAGAMRARFGVAAHAQLATALIASGSPYGESAELHTLPVIDRATSLLADEAASVCRDTSLSATARAARVACLDRRAGDVTSIVTQLSQPTPGGAEGAPDAAWSLTDPQPCTDGPTGARAIAPSVRDRLAKIYALSDGRHTDEALAAAKQLVDDTRASHDTPSMVQVAQVLGELQDQIDHAAAAASFQLAETGAEELGDDLGAASALASLATDAVMGGAGQYAQAHRDIELARAKLARVGGNPELEIRLAFIESQVLMSEQRGGDAERALLAVLKRAGELYPANHPHFAQIYGTLAQIEDGIGKHADELANAQKCYDLAKAAYGDGHPTTVEALLTLGIAQGKTDHLDDARNNLRHVLGMFPPGHPLRLSAQAGLGSLELQAKNFPAARAAFEDARAGYVAAEGSASNDVALMDDALGGVYQELGDLDHAIASDREAVAIYRAEGDDGTAHLAPALAGLCDALLTGGNAKDALPLATQALALLEARPADASPQALADARLAMAKALWETHGDPHRARDLAAAAEHGGTEPARKQLATDWLAAHQ
jgi:tetratricopeptide (TPR) repeat protein/predicted Ser/Thr protein kinase